MTLGNDERALVAIAGSLLSASDAPPLRPCSPALVELLRRHHLRPLAHALGVEGLEEASRECALTAAFHWRTLEEIGEAFATGGIPWAVVKGAAYAWSLYERPELRPMSDLDLLVKADDFGRAGLCLEASGFRERAVSSRTRHAQTYFREAHEIVDLHRSILQPLRSNAALARVWARSTPSEALPGCFELDRVDLCSVHIAHMARHEFVVPLVSYVDLQRLLATLSETEIRLLHEELRRWRLDFAFEVIEEVTRAIVASASGEPVPERGVRMRLVMPTMSELVACRHRSRRTQISKKLALFPRDSMALGFGWALRTAEDRLIRRR